MSRSRKDLSVLFLLSLAVRLATAALTPRPGYMDTAYYAAGAVRLAQGGGLTEPFLWNYLDDPAGLPHPAFLYWMPLPSLLAAPFAALFPGSFFALQFPFALLSALLPPITYGLAWQATGRRRTAWLAGLLTLFSGFFFPYWTLPETFTPFALFGSLALWLAARPSPASGLLPFASGLLAGLAHLTRPDGVLLLPILLLAPLLQPRRRDTQRPTGRQPIVHSPIVHWSLTILGYLLVMAPWFLRNRAVVGAPLPPAGAKTLWLTHYDDLFCYRCDLSPASYLAWGWGNILRSKLWALGVNLERFLAEDCLIFLFPFVLIGLYRLRRRPATSSSPAHLPLAHLPLAHLPLATCLLATCLLATCLLAYLLLTYLLHSLAFTFPGPRGGFFHASVAALPALLTVGAVGLEEAVRWTARRRRWNLRQAQAVFSIAAVVMAAALSLYVAAQKLPTWREADQVYREIGEWLTRRGVDGTVVMVANPPAFWYHTGRPAVVVPNEDEEGLLEVCRRYGVDYLVLDANCPSALGPLCAGRATSPRLSLAATFAGEEVRVWEVRP